MTFTQPPATTLELDDEAQGYVAALRQLNAQAAQLDEARAVIRGHLEKILGDATEGLVDGRPVVTWRWSKPSTVTDVTRLKAELPDVWAAYQKPREPARPLKFVTPKDSDG